MNNKKLIHVGFGLDGVIADWVQAYTTYSNKRNGTPILKTESIDIKEFNMYPWYQSKKQFIETFNEWAKKPNAFTNIEDVSVGNTIETNNMTRKFETTYITARMTPLDESNVYMQTRAWLDKRGLTGRLFVSENKGDICKAFDVDYFIDDKPSNLEMITKSSRGTVPVLMRRSYQTNEEQKNFSTVSDIKDYHNLIRRRL